MHDNWTWSAHDANHAIATNALRRDYAAITKSLIICPYRFRIYSHQRRADRHRRLLIYIFFFVIARGRENVVTHVNVTRRVRFARRRCREHEITRPQTSCRWRWREGRPRESAPLRFTRETVTMFFPKTKRSCQRSSASFECRRKTPGTTYTLGRPTEFLTHVEKRLFSVFS